VAQNFFGQVWGNLGKNLRTPKTLPAPTPMSEQLLKMFKEAFLNREAKRQRHLVVRQGGWFQKHLSAKFKMI